MTQFLIKRFIGLVFVLLGVSFITFIMGYLAPGDPIQQLIGQRANPELHAKLAHIYGLDLPWYQQYFSFIFRLLRGDLGLSFDTLNRPVWDILKDGVPVSVELGLLGLCAQLLIGVPLGVIAALRAGTWLDTVSMTVALTLFAMPAFLLAVIFQVFIVFLHFSIGSTWPVQGWGNPWQYGPAELQFKLGPVLVFAAFGLAFYARLTRTSILEVLRQDYIRTARAKGLQERVVITRHTVRNAMIPLITAIGVALGFLVTGAFFTETIFNIPGIGYTAIQSINTRDYPVIQAVAVMLATAVVLGNMVSDILYTVADPRIKVS